MELTSIETLPKTTDNNTCCFSLLDTYFSLHWDTDEPAFYTSEVISNTMNPSFRIQTKPHCIEWFGYSLSFMVIRLWGKPSVGQSDEERQNEFKLVTEWYLDLNFLSKIGNSASKKKNM